MHNEFAKEEKYKLYRTVKEILHPTISKKNISNYKIIIDENNLPLRVFYPKKVSNINKAIIYVPGEGKVTKCEGKYSEISTNLSKNLDSMVITIDYEEDKNSITELTNNVFDTIKKIYIGLVEAKITKENITLMGDSTSSTILLNIVDKLHKNKIEVGKMILFYPLLSGEYFTTTKYKSLQDDNTVNHDLTKRIKRYYTKKLSKEEYASKEIFPLLNKKKKHYPNTVILIGNTDPLIDENKEFAEREKIPLNIIGFAYHGFLNTKDKEIIKEYTTILNDFINNNN